MFKPGDIILVRSGNWFGNLILWFLRKTDPDSVYFSHAALIKDDKTVLQARFKIQEDSIEHMFEIWKQYKVVRYKKITPKDTDIMISYGNSLLGLSYGYLRFILYTIDAILHTKFSNLITDKNNQICSTLISYLFYKTLNFKFNDVNWEECSPDDVDDEVTNNSCDWEIILEKK